MHPARMAEAGVVELRQYTLKSGAAPRLVELFERELVEPQEEAGMCVAGLFLDRDNPDRFVWLRGFFDMEARAAALERFYHGRVWRQFRDQANATMLDSDDVLLLRPTDPSRPPQEPAGLRGDGAAPPTQEWVSASIYSFEPDEQLTAWLTEEFVPAVETAFGVPVATFRTEPTPNNFAALPVRSDNVFVWMAAFVNGEDYREAVLELESSVEWRLNLWPRLEAQLHAHQCLRLQPTGRSQHPATSPRRRSS